MRADLLRDPARHTALAVSGGMSHTAVCLLSNVVEILDRRRRLYSERTLSADQFLSRVAQAKSTPLTARRHVLRQHGISPARDRDVARVGIGYLCAEW